MVPARAGRSNEGKPQVILWPDTFNNHFHPETAQAAVEVLEAAGYQVIVPEQTALLRAPALRLRHARHGRSDCCGRFSTRSRQQIAAGMPLVGLEPSCVAVFRDELLNLFPDDEDAQAAEPADLPAQRVPRQRGDYQPPKLQRKAVVHGHCHHKAIMTMDAEEKILTRLGLDYDVLDSGCCGMAGAFGFERGDHYDVSIKARRARAAARRARRRARTR